MFCPKCGAVVSNGERFCPKCGASVGNPSGPSSASTQQNQWQPQSNQWQPQSNQWQQSPQRPAMPMNWFKFLIYFALFASAVLNLLSAIGILSGAVYGEVYGRKVADILYEIVPSWKTLDMVMGAILLGLSALAVYTRFRLAGFHRNGPTLLYAVYGVNAGANLLYLIGVNSLISESRLPIGELDSTSTIVGIVVSIAMIGVNYVYFQKRAAMFKN